MKINQSHKIDLYFQFFEIDFVSKSDAVENLLDFRSYLANEA